MTQFDDVVARLTNDPSFADAIRTDPARALRGFRLDNDQLRRLEQMVAPSPTTPPPNPMFRASDAGDAGEPARAANAGVGAARSAGRTGLIASGIAVLGATTGVLLGASTGSDPSATPQTAVAIDSTPDATADAPINAVTGRSGTATYYGCSDDSQLGAALGDLQRGDEVWVIGRSGIDYLVIRNPRQLTSPAWIDADNLVISSEFADVPELTCDSASTAAAAPPPIDATTTTIPSPTSTAPSATPAPTATPTTPAPTTPADTTGPTVTISPATTTLCSFGLNSETILQFGVAANDPTGPVTINSVTWARGSGSGTAASLGGGQHRLSAPLGGSGSIITITATATDGAGNVGSTSVQVTYAETSPPCTPG
jgi:hypothetical protein